MLRADDRLAIHELYARYNLYVDTDRENEWVDLWTPDAVFEGGSVSRGHEELHAFMRRRRERLDSQPFHSAQHWNNSIVLTERADFVEGVCYLIRLAKANKPGPQDDLVFPNNGAYYDRIVRHGDGWRFAARKMYSSMADLAARRLAEDAAAAV